MSKSNRGAGIRKTLTKDRGECPLCKRTGVKLRHQVNQGEEQINACKQCYAKSTKSKK